MTGDEPEPDESASLEELMGWVLPVGGGATARFGPAEAAIIRDLVGQVAELLGGDAPDEDPPDDRPRRRRRTDWPARTTWRR